MTKRHKVFVSFHHDDQEYKDQFVDMMEGYIVDESIHDRDIDDNNLRIETIRQKIRDNFIADATVTVVLVGTCTWQRKHVDWEIGSSLRNTKYNPRCGLLGILLPTHPNYKQETYDGNLVPPRLADNCGSNSYALIYDWSDSANDIQKWIHEAFTRRDKINPDNSRQQFRHNRSGECLQGWS